MAKGDEDAAIFTAAEKTAPAMLFSRDLHVFLLPKSVNTLEIHTPLTLEKKSVDAIRAKAVGVGPKDRL
jgi:hypothetical protein